MNNEFDLTVRNACLMTWNSTKIHLIQIFFDFGDSSTHTEDSGFAEFLTI